MKIQLWINKAPLLPRLSIENNCVHWNHFIWRVFSLQHHSTTEQSALLFRRFWLSYFVSFLYSLRIIPHVFGGNRLHVWGYSTLQSCFSSAVQLLNTPLVLFSHSGSLPMLARFFLSSQCSRKKKKKKELPPRKNGCQSSAHLSMVLPYLIY